MKKILSFIIAAAFLLLNILSVSAETVDTNATSCVLIDSKSGQILYQMNPDERLYPASTTKVMTAILALEKGNLDQMMTASQAAVNDIGVDGMNIGIIADEQLRLEDLLNALIVRSANETANIIAENICPTRKEFVDLMNAKAKELGATDTNFVNPCGAHNPNHYTTASDFSKIARYAMTIPKFREIAAKESFTLPATNKHPDWPVITSTNKLLKRTSDYFSRIIGIKTGYTSQAGNNLISAAVNSDGMELIAVVMGEKGPNSEKNVFNDSKELLEYGFKNFSIQKFEDANTLVSNVSVTDAEDNATLDLITKSELSNVLPLDKSKWNIVKKEHLNTNISAPVKQGDVLGYIEYGRNGISIGKVDVIAAKDIEKSKKAVVIETAKNTAGNPLVKRVALGALICIGAFIALRLTLRKVSRTLKMRRQENE